MLIKNPSNSFDGFFYFQKFNQLLDPTDREYTKCWHQ